ncbi:MAG TPA: cytochrome C oxidase subunit IV family protein [Chthoniobacterales bacterium]|nr:cytochrome C oxidase subunit IV family protein [Chthoniobacterales bacterium]
MNESHEPIADAGVLSADAEAAQAAHDEHVAHDVSKHIRSYLLVGLTLIAFTAITVGLSYVDFGTQKANVAVAMLVATFKAALVAAIFMHLSNEKRMIYRILIFTAFFVLGLFFLTYLAWYDPIVR